MCPPFGWLVAVLVATPTVSLTASSLSLCLEWQVQGVASLRATTPPPPRFVSPQRRAFMPKLATDQNGQRSPAALGVGALERPTDRTNMSRMRTTATGTATIMMVMKKRMMQPKPNQKEQPANKRAHGQSSISHLTCFHSGAAHIETNRRSGFAFLACHLSACPAC